MLRACIRTPDGPKEPLINLIGEVRDDGDPLFFCEAQCESLGELAERVLAPEEAEIIGEDAFEKAWQARLERNLDNARLPVSTGPNWRLETIRLARASRTAIVCTMNHALEDQRSSNLMLDGILAAAAGVGAGSKETSGPKEGSSSKIDFPPSMEMALIEGETFRANTMGYMWNQATAAISQPRVLPEGLPSVEEREQGGDDGAFGVAKRRTCCEFAVITGNEVNTMLQACRYVWEQRTSYRSGHRHRRRSSCSCTIYGLSYRKCFFFWQRQSFQVPSRFPTCKITLCPRCCAP